MHINTSPPSDFVVVVVDIGVTLGAVVSMFTGIKTDDEDLLTSSTLGTHSETWRLNDSVGFWVFQKKETHCVNSYQAFAETSSISRSTVAQESILRKIYTRGSPVTVILAVIRAHLQ